MSIKASNNPFPHDPDDNFADKLDRGGYVGTAQDLKNEIDTFIYPDKILVKGTIVKTENNIAIPALSFTCRIDQEIYTNTESYTASISSATIGYQRMDILVFTKYSTIVKIQGPEGLESAQEPATPDGTIKIGFFIINGINISEPEIPENELSEKRELFFALSDETSNLTLGNLISFRMPFAMVLSEVRISVNEAPTVSSIIVDIKESGVSIFSTRVSIDATELTSVTAATPAVISDLNLADDALITISTTQIGSGNPGKGLKILFKGRKL